MTLIYTRPVVGLAVHAFVIGAGEYPFAKAGIQNGRPAVLDSVQDLPSAAAGAALVADWLLAHSNHLPAPLASIEMLLSDPAVPSAGGSYSWSNRPGLAPALADGGTDPRVVDGPVEAATTANVQVSGTAWADRLTGGTEPNIAIFFICGHGIGMPTRSLVLLEDLAGLPSPASAWDAALDVQLLASTMGRVDRIKNAYLFIDACQEVITPVLVAESDPTTKAGPGVRFFSPDRLGVPASKTLLLVPGAMGALAFDDGAGGGGRYTHVLLEALSGAAAQDADGLGTWGVFSDQLARAMAELYPLRWTDTVFEPTPIGSPSTDQPLVSFPAHAPPKVPVRIRLEPVYAAYHPGAVIALMDAAGQQIAPWNSTGDIWLEWVDARQGLCTVDASFPQGAPFATRAKSVTLTGRRVKPIIVHTVQP